MEQFFINEYHEAEIHGDFHGMHVHVGQFVPGHMAYIQSHQPVPPEPGVTAPAGYHWAFNPSHSDSPGDEVHPSEWVLHHAH
ncbi:MULTISPECIES: hypothetical protein [Paenibacillus]|uniref:Uncharacterized protein n=1 Tax=Paenibacillus polymyxa TaxID=1406 RepID=A0ABX2Z7V8_PAEPO|nr:MULTISPECIES: hypothetical protein [Paenibacillus]ODA07347.1 hypothetical protein A7312_09660 [Paenibacillus polymyxa]OME69634.1 hypothetical protein BK119_14275 [Paenibacillus peoriae]